MAMGWESVVYQIWESAFEVEHRSSFVHHLRKGVANGFLFFFGQKKFSCVGLRRMEVERNRFDVGCILCNHAHVSNGILVD